MGIVFIVLFASEMLIWTVKPAQENALFERSTCNDNQHALFRLAEHGRVYADYYFLEAGN